MPVSTFRIVMRTPGTMAPVESVTVPRIVAVVTCADIRLNPAIDHSRIAPSSLLDTVIKASSDTSCNQLDRSLPSMACAKPSMGRQDPSPCFHRTFGTTRQISNARQENSHKRHKRHKKFLSRLCLFVAISVDRRL